MMELSTEYEELEVLPEAVLSSGTVVSFSGDYIVSSGANIDDLNLTLVLIVIMLGVIEGTLLFRHFRK